MKKPDDRDALKPRLKAKVKEMEAEIDHLRWLLTEAKQFVPEAMLGEISNALDGVPRPLDAFDRVRSAWGQYIGANLSREEFIQKISEIMEYIKKPITAHQPVKLFCDECKSEIVLDDTGFHPGEYRCPKCNTVAHPIFIKALRDAGRLPRL